MLTGESVWCELIIKAYSKNEVRMYESIAITSNSWHIGEQGLLSGRAPDL